MPQSQRKRVVITGVGVVSPNGIGAENFAAACLRGVSGIAAPQNIETSGLRTTASLIFVHSIPRPIYQRLSPAPSID